MGKLPEKGREVVRSLTQHLSPRDWDLSERAMHALHNIASAPGARHVFEVCLLSGFPRDIPPGPHVQGQLLYMEGSAPICKGCSVKSQNRMLACDMTSLGNLVPWCSRVWPSHQTMEVGKGRPGVSLWRKISQCTSTASSMEE